MLWTSTGHLLNLQHTHHSPTPIFSTVY